MNTILSWVTFVFSLTSAVFALLLFGFREKPVWILVSSSIAILSAFKLQRSEL